MSFSVGRGAEIGVSGGTAPLALVHPVGAGASQLDDLGVMEESVEDGAGGGGVAEDLSPVLEGANNLDSVESICQEPSP